MTDGRHQRAWALGVSLLGPRVAILGHLGGKLGGLGATFGALGFSIIFWIGSILGAKRVPKDRHLGRKTEPKSIQNRGANLRAKESSLGVVLVRFLDDFQDVLGANVLIFQLF